LDPQLLSIDALMIERVQRKFLSSAVFFLKVPCPPHDFEPVRIALNLFNLIPDRRRSANI